MVIFILIIFNSLVRKHGSNGLTQQRPVTNGSNMAKNQKRRLEVTTGTAGVANSFIDMEFENDAMVNLHGYRATVAIEPQDADANSNGIMGVWVLPGGVILNGNLPQLYGEWGDEDFSQYLWGFKAWGATNQTPFHWEFSPTTTRNMARGSRIVLHILQAGISGGISRINTTQTGFVTSVS